MSADALVAELLAGDRRALARAITLVESRLPEHQARASTLLAQLPTTRQATRIGISGTPGVGQSTFIEAFGRHLTGLGKTVAVLAVDPTSQVSGGSILGDKTRMEELARDPRAFIRPSPSSGALGGVGPRTREAVRLCEAYGFDVILVETVGVGQSETAVAQLVDCFVMLLQPGAGDDLQGIKRGILELVDLVLVTKSDGPNTQAVAQATHHYQQALHILRQEGWHPPVLAVSGLARTGLEDAWANIERFIAQLDIPAKRRGQALHWFDHALDEGLRAWFAGRVDAAKLAAARSAVASGAQSVPAAVRGLIQPLEE
jgi:LAO/AO transport system kinase